MYDKAAELQERVKANKNCDKERQQLKRVIELINVYEKIVEGNYIDNLIRAQRVQELAKNGEKRT